MPPTGSGQAMGCQLAVLAPPAVLVLEREAPLKPEARYRLLAGPYPAGIGVAPEREPALCAAAGFPAAPWPVSLLAQPARRSCARSGKNRCPFCRCNGTAPVLSSCDLTPPKRHPRCGGSSCRPAACLASCRVVVYVLAASRRTSPAPALP